LKSGVRFIDEIPILGVAYLIPFKARACLDLTRRKDNGEKIDSRDIKKHKNDVLRLVGLLSPVDRIVLPKVVWEDMQLFLSKIKNQSTQYERLSAIYVEP
jgi:hypothetical protein